MYYSRQITAAHISCIYVVASNISHLLTMASHLDLSVVRLCKIILFNLIVYKNYLTQIFFHENLLDKKKANCGTPSPRTGGRVTPSPRTETGSLPPLVQQAGSLPPFVQWAGSLPPLIQRAGSLPSEISANGPFSVNCILLVY